MYFRCYDEESGDVVYVLSHPFKPASMKYYSGRLFCIGKGAMSVLDFTKSTITNAQVDTYCSQCHLSLLEIHHATKEQTDRQTDVRCFYVKVFQDVLCK